MTQSKNSRNFWVSDPFLVLLKKILRLSDLKITVYFTFISIIIELGLGWLASYNYQGNAIRFTDIRVYYYALIQAFLITPFLLFFYTWQPKAIGRMLDKFEEAKIIKKITPEGMNHVENYNSFLVKFRDEINRKRWVIISIVFTIVIWLVQSLFSWPSEFNATGQNVFWLEVKWYFVARLLNQSISLYIISLVIIRQIVFTRYSNFLFQWFKIQIRPLHPDHAGGLGALGELTINNGFMAVGLGVLSMFYSIHPLVMMGVELTNRIDVFVFWGLYILVVSISIIAPIISARKSMELYKREYLDGISEEFARTLSFIQISLKENSTLESIKDNNEKLHELKDLYTLTEQVFPTLPVSPLKSFTVTAILPVISSIVTLAIDILTK